MLSPGVTYREDFRCWWPNYDKWPEKNFTWVQNLIADMDKTIQICKKRRVAVQAGGHAGLWPIRLAQHFEAVHTWEPEPALYTCLVQNIRDYPNVYPHPSALGSYAGTALMLPSHTAGSWRIDEAGSVPVFVTTIDSKNLSRCDAIFLDIEGHEVEALRGAARTIEKFSPVLHLEEHQRCRDELRKHVLGLGYREIRRVHLDVVYARV